MMIHRYTFIVLLALCTTSQAIAENKNNGTLAKRNAETTLDTTAGRRLYWGKRTDGYIVYDKDTISGLVMLYRKHLIVEQPLDGEYSYFYNFRLNDKRLKTVLMYNAEKKPVCLTRVSADDSRLLRVVHEGKMNIYDGRIGFVYSPKDIDKHLLLISYNGVVDDLSSFLTETTKSDLVMYINDIYGLKLKAKDLTWSDLLLKIDELD